METKVMRTKKQKIIIFLGWILIIIGFGLSMFSFFVSHDWIYAQARSNYGMYYFWDGLNTFRELSIPLSIILIVVGGIFLSTLAIIPSNKENNSLKTAELKYVNGEITKEQYDQIKKDLND
jgi:uncharacterized membrane protein